MTVSIGILDSNPNEEWESILHIGNKGIERWPGIWFHETAGEQNKIHGFTLVYGTTENWHEWQDPTAAGGAFTDNQVINFKSIQTQDRLIIIQDGQTIFDEEWDQHPLANDVNVYVGDPWDDPADVTITNLVITTEEDCSS